MSIRIAKWRPFLLLLLLVALALYALRSGWIDIPEHWKPWTPLRIDDPPTLLTGWKLARASNDADQCLRVLAQAPMRFVALPDRETGPDCGFRNAVRIERSSVSVGESFSLSCRAALSLALWERHVLQQAAQRHLQQPVAGIEHYGSYACRNVYSREGARRSRHATADALDIAGFVLADGSRIRVLHHWHAGDNDGNPSTASADARAQFLRELHGGACRYFDAVLGPDYNAAHADHFHFDRGGFGTCR